MFTKIFRKFWMHLQISLRDDYTVEGFEKTKIKFELPDNLSQQDPLTKRRLTICNLFANQNLSIKDICIVLDTNIHQVIDVLIENQLVKERRKNRNRTKQKGSLSITPDESASESANPNSSQESKGSDGNDREPDSNLHYETAREASAPTASESKTDGDSEPGRRIA